MNPITSILAALLLAAGIGAGVQTWRLQSLQTTVAEEHAALEKARADAESRARDAEQLMADSARKAADAYSRQVSKVRADADGARAALAGLLNATGSSGDAAQDSAATRSADDATRARAVVASCAGTVQTLAANLDETEGRLAALQNYVSAVLSQGAALK